MRKAQLSLALLLLPLSSCAEMKRRLQPFERREDFALGAVTPEDIARAGPEFAAADFEAEPMLPPRAPEPARAPEPELVYGPEPPDSFARFLTGERVLGAAVSDLAGCNVGRLRDLVMDPATGAIVSALIDLDEAPAGAASVAILGSDLRWVANGDAMQVRIAKVPAAAVVPQAELAELFRMRQPSTLQGEITEMAPAKDSSVQVMFNLREASNLHQRVYVGPAKYLFTNGVELEQGQAVTLEGLPTRDDKGKLFVCSALRLGEKTLKLRDEAGLPLWTQAETLPGVSLLAMRDRPLVTADGAPASLTGFVFDAHTATVPFVTVAIDSQEHLLPLEELELLEDGSWSAHRTRAEIATLPAVTTQDLFLLGGHSGR